MTAYVPCNNDYCSINLAVRKEVLEGFRDVSGDSSKQHCANIDSANTFDSPCRDVKSTEEITSSKDGETFI